MDFRDLFDNYELIDLSLLLDEQLPASWPTHIPMQHKVWNWYKEVTTKEGACLTSPLGPYYSDWVLIDMHTGTHFDAPSHFIPKPETNFDNACEAGKITGEHADLKQFMGPALVIDVRELTGQGSHGESPYIKAAHISNWEKENGTIPANSIVIFHTGWDKFYVKGEEGKKYAYNPIIRQEGPGWPSPDVDAMELLVERGVRCIGTDGTSMGATHCGLPVHVSGLSKGVLYVEALTNINKMHTKGDFFMFLPIKLAESSGGIGRAVAFVKKA